MLPVAWLRAGSFQTVFSLSPPGSPAVKTRCVLLTDEAAEPQGGSRRQQRGGLLCQGVFFPLHHKAPEAPEIVFLS